MSEAEASIDDRVSFIVAEAVLSVVRKRIEGFADDAAAWEAFIRWRGEGEAEYLRRVRAGGKYIFYTLLQDLYVFAEEKCGAEVGLEVGRELTIELLRRHLPDLLQATAFTSGTLAEQIGWLVERFLGGSTGEVYRLSRETKDGGKRIEMTIAFRHPAKLTGGLQQAGHRPEEAFRRSFQTVHGALAALLEKAVHGHQPDQLRADRKELEGRFTLELSETNRFHYEGFIEILLDYVRRLHERSRAESDLFTAEGALCSGRAMRSVWERIRKASASGETVVLCGESGTGKSYFARIIHAMSGRRDGPIVEVGLTSDVGADNLIQSNLFGHVRGAFTGADEEKHGLFALADGGTLFLDEIGDASLELQAKLLRVLETKRFKMLGGVRDVEVDVRILAATNRDLQEEVRAGRFREDLFYRLNVIRIDLPPLRRRPEDIPALAERLLDRIGADANRPDLRLPEETMDVLASCPWPGNIRQMENALRRAVALSESPDILPADLPPEILEAGPPPPRDGKAPAPALDADALARMLAEAPRTAGEASFDWPGHVDHWKREFMRALINHHRGNLARIAEHWDRASPHTLLKWIREAGLEEELQAAREGRSSA